MQPSPFPTNGPPGINSVTPSEMLKQTLSRVCEHFGVPIHDRLGAHLTSPTLLDGGLAFSSRVHLYVPPNVRFCFGFLGLLDGLCEHLASFRADVNI